MKKQHPRVSVIIPVYNGSEFLGAAVQSVLGQTYTDYEIIVADDGSTKDNPRAALEQFGDKVTLLELPHKGICATRNAAIKHSSGEFIALLDSDDLWEADKLELQVAYLDAHPDVALVYSYSTNFTTEAKEAVALVKKVDLEGDVYKTILLRGSFAANSTLVIHRAVFDEVGGYDESLVAMEDYELNLRICRNHKVGRIAKSLMRRRIHPGSFYSSGYDSQYIYQLPVFEKLLSDPEIEAIMETTKRAFISNMILKFIFKNLFDEQYAFIDQKLQDLERYSADKAEVARALVEARDATIESWAPLIEDFEAWHDDVQHKAALFRERRKTNFNGGAGRL